MKNGEFLGALCQISSLFNVCFNYINKRDLKVKKELAGDNSEVSKKMDVDRNGYKMGASKFAQSE